jgi:hypothetical protein
MLIAQQLQSSGQFLAALDWYQSVYAYNLPREKRKIYRGLVKEESIIEDYTRTPEWLRGDNLNPHEIVQRSSPRANAYTRFTIMSLVRCFLEFAAAEFTRGGFESIPRARALYMSALDLLQEIEQMSEGRAASPFPPNPLIASLRLHGETNLFKIRTGRNIAGLELELVAQAESTASSVSAADGQLVLAPVAAHRATPYRFSTLIARAKELVSIAQQMESAFLAAIEKRDAEAYSLLQAKQHIELAHATVDLQVLRVAEAETAVGLAKLQKDRARVQANTYEEWIADGLLSEEESAKTWTGVAAGLSTGDGGGKEHNHIRAFRRSCRSARGCDLESRLRRLVDGQSPADASELRAARTGVEAAEEHR